MVNLLAANSSMTMFIVLGVFIVLMVVTSILPQRKRQKQQQQMHDSIKVGSKIETIGGFIGTIVELRDTTMVLDVGDENHSTLIVMDRQAIRQNLSQTSAEPKKEAEKQKVDFDKGEDVSERKVDD